MRCGTRTHCWYTMITYRSHWHWLLQKISPHTVIVTVCADLRYAVCHVLFVSRRYYWLCSIRKQDGFTVEPPRQWRRPALLYQNIRGPFTASEYLAPMLGFKVYPNKAPAGCLRCPFCIVSCSKLSIWLWITSARFSRTWMGQLVRNHRNFSFFKYAKFSYLKTSVLRWFPNVRGSLLFSLFSHFFFFFFTVKSL